MDATDVATQARRIGQLCASQPTIGSFTQASEFLRTFAGERSSFFTRAAQYMGWEGRGAAQEVAPILGAFADFVEAGLSGSLSVSRQAQVDVVSDIMEQAQTLLADGKVHPAAPIVLVGAALEEFLRTWIEDQGLSIGNRKPGIDAYSSALRAAALLSKQDVKDVSSWAGIRNSAAHGEWEAVDNRDRARIMLEGVNLFMRQKVRSTG